MKLRPLFGILGGACVVGGACVLIAATDLFRFFDTRATIEEREFSAAYKKLQIGMRADEVEKSFGRVPDFECTFRGSNIHFYKAPAPASKWLDFRGEVDQSQFTDGQEIADLGGMPDPYDHVAVAYGSDDTLIAFTHIGEVYHVNTKSRGLVKGSGFIDLKDSDFIPAAATAERAEALEP